MSFLCWINNLMRFNCEFFGLEKSHFKDLE